ncbi:MAG: DMT family transporter [Anaerovoracaceae bacterium]|jgi:drug/metabolite transporter (DMT)-like permease
MSENDQRRKVSQPVAVIGLLVAACFWGGMYVVAKDAMEVISANWMLSIRFLLAFIIMIIIYWKYAKKVTKEDLKGCVVTGLFMGTAYTSMTIGLSLINAGNTAFLTDTYVIWIPIVLFIGWKIKPGPHIFIAAALALIGVAFMTLQGGLHLRFGDLITIVGSFLWTGELIAIDIYSKKIKPQLLVTFQTLVVCIFTFFMALILREPVPTLQVLTEPKLMLQFAYLVILATFVANSCQNYFQSYVSSTTVSVIFPTESIFATAFGVLFLGEVLTGMTVVGMLFLVAAILMNTLGHKIFKPKNSPLETPRE